MSKFLARKRSYLWSTLRYHNLKKKTEKKGNCLRKICIETAALEYISPYIS